MLAALPGEAGIEGEIGREEIATLLLGPDSPVYRVFFDILKLDLWAHGTAVTQAEEPPLELANFCPSPAVPEPSPRRSARTVPPTPDIRLPCVAGITGKTPGKGKSVLNPHAEFVERCVNCDGMFPSIKYDPAKKDQRMSCNVCERKTTHF